MTTPDPAAPSPDARRAAEAVWKYLDKEGRIGTDDPMTPASLEAVLAPFIAPAAQAGEAEEILEIQRRMQETATEVARLKRKLAESAGAEMVALALKSMERRYVIQQAEFQELARWREP